MNYTIIEKVLFVAIVLIAIASIVIAFIPNMLLYLV